MTLPCNLPLTSLMPTDWEVKRKETGATGHVTEPTPGYLTEVTAASLNRCEGPERPKLRSSRAAACLGLRTRPWAS